MNVLCKSVCALVEPSTRPDGTTWCERVRLHGVYSTDPGSENKWFAVQTPCLAFDITLENPAAFGTFVKDREYYITVSDTKPA